MRGFLSSLLSFFPNAGWVSGVLMVCSFLAFLAFILKGTQHPGDLSTEQKDEIKLLGRAASLVQQRPWKTLCPAYFSHPSWIAVSHPISKSRIPAWHLGLAVAFLEEENSNSRELFSKRSPWRSPGIAGHFFLVTRSLVSGQHSGSQR